MKHRKKFLIGGVLLLFIAFGGISSFAPTPYIAPAPDISSPDTTIGSAPIAKNSAPLTATEATEPSVPPRSNAGQPASSAAKESSNVTLITTRDKEAVTASLSQDAIAITDVLQQPDGSSVILADAALDHPTIRALQQPGNGVTRNYIYRTLHTFTNPDTYYSSQWNLTNISAPAAWDISQGSAQTSIAIIDTGVLSSQTLEGTTYTQADFPESKIWRNSGEIGPTTEQGPAPNCTSRGVQLDKKCNNHDDDGNGKIDDWQGWDFMGGFNGNSALCPNYRSGTLVSTYYPEDNDPQPYSCDSPQYPSALNKTQFNGTCEFGVSSCSLGHGTMVASAAASLSNNGALIAGVDHQATIMNLRVLDGYGYTTTDRVAQAVDYAWRNGADVINLSLAVSDCSNGFVDPVLEQAMVQAKAAGTVIVAASGNEYLNAVCFPASSSSAIAVGASTQSNTRAGFSNYGPELDVVAPGVDIPVANAPSNAINSSYYPYTSGTSLATPHVAGLASLIRSVKPSASPDEIYRIITTRADRVPGMNNTFFTNEYGYGLINVHTAVRVAQGSSHPVYNLQQPAGCTLLTSSLSERDLAVYKNGYVYNGIDFWLPKENTPGWYGPNTSTNMCQKP